MFERINFIFCLHNHQPVGNFDHVVQDGLVKAYLPLLKTLLKYPWFKFALHTSGSLWDYIERMSPEYIELTRELVKRGQCELIGGGYYEPILSVCNSYTSIMQQKKMNRYLSERFGTKVNGQWTAERVWEPNTYRDCKYTLLDDYHFLTSVDHSYELDGYYMTDGGNGERALALFPIDQKMRYLLPFREPAEFLTYCRERLDWSLQNNRPEPMLCFGDDGEKFGIWPKTDIWVWEKGWMQRFIDALEQNQDWLRTVTPSEYMKITDSRGYCHPPTCSYRELGEWTLPPETRYQFEQLSHIADKLPYPDIVYRTLRGGHWRQFFSKYHESNMIMRRINWFVWKGAQKLMPSLFPPKDANTEKLLHDVMEEMLPSQCNCPLWHGVFGGMYLNYLRNANLSAWCNGLATFMRNLTDAPDKVVDVKADISEVKVDADHEAKPLTLNNLPLPEELLLECEDDFDLDQRDEKIGLGYGWFVVAKDTEKGNVTLVLDDLVSKVSWGNSLTRYFESYHKELDQIRERSGNSEVETIHGAIRAKQGTFDRPIGFDAAVRYPQIDYIADAGIDPSRALELMYAGRWKEGIRPCAPLLPQARILFGSIPSPENTPEKEIALYPDATMAWLWHWCFYTDEEKMTDRLLLCEFNLTVLTADADDRYLVIPTGEKTTERAPLRDPHVFDGIGRIGMFDGWRQSTIWLKAPKKTTWLHYPVETLSLSEGGLERTYQGSALVACVPIKPGANFEISLSVERSQFFEIVLIKTTCI